MSPTQGCFVGMNNYSSSTHSKQLYLFRLLGEFHASNNYPARARGYVIGRVRLYVYIFIYQFVTIKTRVLEL